MKKTIVTTFLLLLSIFAAAQEYPFSIKSGTGKQTLLFIPGFASSGTVWNETVAALKKDYTCVVLTMPGFAGVAPEQNPTFENWKAQIGRYIKNEKIEKPIVIGHSMGGALALAIAADFPDLTRKIVVVDALPCLMALTNPNFQANPNNDCTAMVQELTSMTNEQFIQMQQVSIASLTTETSKFDEIVSWGVTSDRETFAKIFCDFSNTDLRARIKKITVPTLLLLEPYFKNIASAIQEQYKNLSHAQLRYATKGLHFVMYDDRDWYIKELTDFSKEQ
ncbi:alpha/beta fold hydrolase [Flavobacterium kingsejongi]|uniref:Alpha/beta hydrolase n=1 Tax=Flavobacterium kingsejongi TaxID=1678728 RepID=A0A2S1LMJ8_9FLAO|nr:alpha/beta hydrolase [Flavobacterium kingsejongi]AWG24908.1 alpha/beta hydrolase [Flavobacterium kingsejongi]